LLLGYLRDLRGNIFDTLQEAANGSEGDRH